MQGEHLALQQSDEDDDDSAAPGMGGFHPAKPPSVTELSSSSSPWSFLRHPVASLRQHLNRYYVVLMGACLAISCSGTLLRWLPDTPPLLKGYWRLQFMSAVLFPGFVYQYRKADEALITRFLSNDALLTITVGGLAASAHFGCWIWSLNHTSLSHSLFFVTTYPLVVVAVMLLQGKTIDWREGAGVLVGLVGSALLLSDTAASEDSAADDASSGGGAVSVSFIGDFVAFLGAVTFVIYLFAGQRVRSWMPLFLYTMPMTLVSAVPLLLASVAFEPVTLAGFTPASVFGFLAPSSLVILLLIALLPAGLGHTGINYVVKRVSDRKSVV